MKLNYDERLSSFAFNINLRHYSKVLVGTGAVDHDALVKLAEGAFKAGSETSRPGVLVH